HPFWSGFHSNVWYAAKTLDARLRGHDAQEVMPAHAGIQEPYIQWQAALDAHVVSPMPVQGTSRALHATSWTGSVCMQQTSSAFASAKIEPDASLSPFWVSSKINCVGFRTSSPKQVGLPDSPC